MNWGLLFGGLISLVSISASAEFLSNPSTPTTRLEAFKTSQMIDQQQPSLADLNQGQERAKEMTRMLQTLELQETFNRASERGNDVLRDNPDIVEPASVLGVGVSLWTGRNLAIVKTEDFKLFSHLEGRSRSGSLDLTSALVNGQLRFDQTSGLNMDLKRSVAEIDSTAQVTYNFRNQTISTQVSHALATHLAVSVGASQDFQMNTPEKNARIVYNINF